MKPSNEEKARFFACYWGQNVITDPSSHIKEWKYQELLSDYVSIKYAYLELKPLSSISDEDAIELVTFRKDLGDQKDRDILLRHAKEKVKFESSLNTMYPYHYDHLRSKGYALPWMGISVDDQVKYGWIKLKQQ